MRQPLTTARLALGALAAACSLLSPSLVSAQNNPRIGYVYPAGGRQGSTFNVLVGGQFLNGVTNVFVSGEGVRARVADYTRPLNGREATLLRDQLAELQKKRAAALGQGRGRPGTNDAAAVWSPADEKTLAEVRRKLAQYNRKRQVSPAIAEDVIVEVTVERNAPVGARDFRLGTPAGLSNPLAFRVGDLPEFTQLSSAAVPDAAPRKKGPRADPRPAARPVEEMNVVLPATLNGQIMPGETDRFRFKARKGERLVFAASARALIPYLADAVPGWFQATLAVYDARGREVAYADDFQFDPDPVVCFDVPAEGEYVLEIKDSIYRGREDFVYRVSAGKLPFITGVYPLGGRAGTRQEFELLGWNLPESKLEVPLPETPGSMCPVRVQKDQRISNVRPVAVDDLPETAEQEPNPSDAPQAVDLPQIVNGRIDGPGDRDAYSLAGEPGREIVAEVVARRLGSPLDSALRITDEAGKEVAFNDDFEDKAAGLITHQADSRAVFRLPASGRCRVQVADAQGRGGKEYGYRLRLSAPRPDFELRVTPSVVNIRGGSSVPLTVHVLRKDGFTNAITLSVREPDGFILAGGRIPAGTNQVKVTVSAGWQAPEKPADLVLEGKGFVGGEEVVRVAVPAEDMMQAFAYRHLVPVQELKASVSGRRPARPTARILGQTPVRIPVGGTAKVRIGTPGGLFPAGLDLQLVDPPEGISILKVTASSQGPEIELQCDSEKVKSGQRGNLIVSASRPGNAPGKAKKGNGGRTPSAGLPAIPFEIVDPK